MYVEIRVRRATNTASPRTVGTYRSRDRKFHFPQHLLSGICCSRIQGFPAWSLGLSLSLRVTHAPGSPAFSPCLREVVCRPMRACFHAACLFSNLLSSPLLFFPCALSYLASCKPPILVLSGLAELPSGAVLASDLPEHMWSLSFIWRASCIAGHCELSCNRCVFLSNEIMHSLRNDDATSYPLASVPGRLSMTAG